MKVHYEELFFILIINKMDSLRNLCYKVLLKEQVLKSENVLPLDLIIELRKKQCVNSCGSRVTASIKEERRISESFCDIKRFEKTISDVLHKKKDIILFLMPMEGEFDMCCIIYRSMKNFGPCLFCKKPYPKFHLNSSII